MQSLLHDLIIALPIAFAALMILDLIASLNQLWKSCEPSTPLSTPLSIPASIPQPLQETTAPAEESARLETMPDPWEFEPSCIQPITTNPKLALVPKNVLLLPPGKPRVEVLKTVETVVSATKRKPGRPRKNAPLDAEFSPNRPATPKRRGRPRKTA